jgi:hypothetical protein
MGQKPSVSRLPTREEILQKKGEGRAIISTIFSWLKDQASFDDLLLLGNPHKCSEYIFLTADALRSVFDVLRVYPDKDQKGVIFFKRIEDLKASQADYRPLCIQIAFFYIRIFQVFGALAMSVLDVDPVYTTALRKDARGQVAQPPWTIGYPLRGGAIPDSQLKEPLKFLAPFLEYSDVADFYKISGTDIYLRKKMVSFNTIPSIGRFQILHKKKDKKETVVTIEITRKEIQPPEIMISVKDSKPRKIKFSPITLKQKDPFINSYTSNEGNDIKYYLIKIVKEIEKEEVSDGRKETAIEQRFVQTGLQAKHISNSIRTPPKTHCVARALQLLSTEGLSVAKSLPSEVFTRMCDPVFFTENYSLPKADAKVSDEIGIFVLNQLFYDTLSETGTKMSGMAEEKHRIFLRELKVLFEDLSIEQKNSLSVGGIAEVKNKIPNICQQGKPLMKTTHTGTIREVRKVAAQMLWFQIEHTAEVTKILGKLFQLPLKPGDKVSLHPNIYKQGILGVNAVAEEARNLLIRYYKKCETLYRMGTVLYARQGNLQAV